MRRRPLVIIAGAKKELPVGDTIHYWQSSTPNNPQDGEIWVDPSSQPSGGIIRQSTPPPNPGVGQLWLDESASFGEYSGYKDITDISYDYPLRLGEAVIIKLNAVSNKPLNIAVDPFTGLYQLTVVVSQNLNGTSDVGFDLKPNNVSVTAGEIDIALYELGPTYSIAAGSAATNTTKTNLWMGSYTDGVAATGFSLFYGMRGWSHATICTVTAVKGVMLTRQEIRNTAWYPSTAQCIWYNTTTVWSSLGSLLCSYPITGHCVVRRLA